MEYKCEGRRGRSTYPNGVRVIGLYGIPESTLYLLVGGRVLKHKELAAASATQRETDEETDSTVTWASHLPIHAVS